MRIGVIGDIGVAQSSTILNCFSKDGKDFASECSVKGRRDLGMRLFLSVYTMLAG